jgi:Ser/Thr protein kinase RdoA (MazF antagonist)
MEDSSFRNRIGYDGKIEDISDAVCKGFNLGKLLSDKLITVGYEDFNLAIETNKGKYFAKVFANYRNDEDCQRYIDIMSATINAGVKTPKLIKSGHGYLKRLEVNGTKLRLCLMDYVEGRTIFDLKEYLNHDEIRFIAKQAAIINSINIKPKFMYDSWAITSIDKEFRERGKCLSSNDMKLIKPLIKEFKDLRIEELPHSFVHGDILTTNVMKDDNNDLWIIDFSVSNYYPRIQELAVLACNLFFNPENKEETENNLKIALKEYQKNIQLTERELSVLPTYTKLSHAMHVLNANYFKIAENNTSEENEYWLQQGRLGLTQ